MKLVKRYARGQDGFTLVELVIASAIGLMVMTALTSVVLASWRAFTVASSRVEASSQIRSFEQRAYDDFAHSAIPPGSGGCPCTAQPIVLAGPSQDAPGSTYQVTYTWDGSAFLDRQTSTGVTTHVAKNVTSFSWYVDGQTVVVSLTVTMQPNTMLSYSESQTLRFYPRVSSP